VYICCYICVLSLALNMGDDRRRAMYDGFDSVTHRHSDAWVRVADEFVALAFAGDARFAKCLCRECQNLIQLKKWRSHIMFSNMALCQTIWYGVTMERWRLPLSRMETRM
jgi:hypothetical protein